MTGYCKDCEEEVEVRIFRDWMGDPGVIGGTSEFIVWECRKCGGTNVCERQEADPD